jgi:hypothetical protein
VRADRAIISAPFCSCLKVCLTLVSGQTPLEVLILQRDRNLDPDIVRVLLSHGADPNKVIHCKGQTPLAFTLQVRSYFSRSF